MNLELSDKKALLLFAIVVVLIIANLVLMLLPKKPVNELSLYKGFAAQTHSTIQKLNSDYSQLSAELEARNDLNAEEKARMKEYYFSWKKDLDWISEKENTVYWQMVASQNPLQANELMRKEMAILVVSNYVFALNNDAVADGTAMLLDENETVAEAKAALSWIQVKDLLNDEIAQEMISETLVQKQDIINETKEVMNKYLEKRKSALQSASTGSYSQFVEAIKLLELSYLLEVSNAS